LLVGDTDRIPHFTGVGPENPATDLYYTTMDGDGDWYPEFPVGRFSVVNAAQLSGVIAKTIAYETSSVGDWTNRVTFMAGDDNHTITEGTHDWVVDNYMDPLGYDSSKLYEHSYDATTQDVHDTFNSGTAMGIYSGHGDEYYWADGPRFDQSDVRGLLNTGKYPLIASFACITGAYALGESFMETWLRTPDNGAVVAVGASVDSYWTEDDILEKRLFDAIYNEGYTAYGSAWLRAKELYLEHFGPTNMTRGYFEMYNVMGDPTVKVLGLDLEITSPAKLPMAPLPPIDAFEISKFHPSVLDLKLVDQFVFVEFRLPGGLVHRRQSPGHGTPFSDAEATVSKARKAAHGNHDKDQRKEDHQPDPDRAAGAATAFVDATGLHRGTGGLVGSDLFEKFAFFRHGAPHFPFGCSGMRWAGKGLAGWRHSC